MFGLRMARQYLDEVLSGEKTFDARSYDTDKRGAIALIDTSSKKILGLVDLVGTRRISEEEYCGWHATGKWAGMRLELRDEFKKEAYFAYDFANPRRVSWNGKAHPKPHERVWVDLGDIDLAVQGSIFD